MGCVGRGFYNEETVCRPIGAYEISKHKAELLVQREARNFSITILRPSIVFGPGRSPEQDSFFDLIKSFYYGHFRLFGEGKSIINIYD